MTEKEIRNVEEVVNALTQPSHTSQCTHLFLLEIKPHNYKNCSCFCHDEQRKKGSLGKSSKERKTPL